MQRLHYIGDSVLVPDAVCEAVMRLARALADERVSDVVRVPIIDEAGTLSEAELLLGPASQLFATPAADVAEIAVPPELVADIKRRTAKLETSHSQPEASTRVTPLRDEFDG